ncbi:FecCD family ABC transporter permease [Paenibacillus sp. MMS18-CY102]|uniref:FecCD family ABC transporter permease n=1 Tax=Paenibacillus sp. MMS18-CY102 TaxID=2682849 RepID=UPI001365DA2F|nr:iron ABC transporter permease [Paenibacillus sp. MMS18-CY102]MWC29801.1 iron chelate uptake ABC transporter family permease subunit [Paenibacillus sp. MMS18-CY102]
MSGIRKPKSFALKIGLSLVALAVIFSLAMWLGAKDVTLRELWSILTNQGGNDDKIAMLREIRYPREVAAVLVGAALAVAGAIMQGLTRNPLADPGLLGLTAGANASLALAVAALPAMNYVGIMLVCFLGAALGMFLVIGLGSLKKGGLSPFRIVLAGSAVSAFLLAASEGISLLSKTSKDVTMWTSGGLIGTTWAQVQAISPVIIVAIVVAMLMSKSLTILSLNEEAAVGLGIRMAYVKTVLYLVIIMLAGAAVALVGNMAFIGMMIPHIVRALFGTDYRIVIPMSVIWGAMFMLMADTLGRTVHAPFETPVVAIMAIFGLPFFLAVVRKGVKAL